MDREDNDCLDLPAEWAEHDPLPPELRPVTPRERLSAEFEEPQ